MDKIPTKIRFLEVINILKETDKDHPLSIDEIIIKLKNRFEPKTATPLFFEKRAIKDDIDILIDDGMIIDSFVGEHGKKLYYCEYKTFDIYELRLLIDAVTSAKFITKKDTKALVDKIKGLTSRNLIGKFQSTIHVDDLVKSNNAELKDYINTIHSAISNKRKLRFQYGNYKLNTDNGNYNAKKEFMLHHNGDYYSVLPYGVVWNNDFYYLVCFDEIKNANINYRIDRMRNVVAMEDTYKSSDFDLTKYLKSCFNMYPGDVDVIKIQFKNQLLNAVIDKLGTGDDVSFIRVNENFFQVRFHGSVNEGLLRWVLMWGADAKVIEPIKLIEMVKEQIKVMNILY